MTLSKRLAVVADFVPEGSFIADVGSDHAQLPLFLLAQKKIRGAQAIENKPGPYERMEKSVLSSPFSGKVVLSLSDGLSALSPEVDTLVLAGMGGKLIKRILSEGVKKLPSIQTLVIDAHSEREQLIPFVASLGYRVVGELFFFDAGIAYDVTKWVKSDAPMTYSPKQCQFGPLSLESKNPDFIAFYSKEKAHYEALLTEKTLSEKNRIEYAKKAQILQEVLHGN